MQWGESPKHAHVKTRLTQPRAKVEKVLSDERHIEQSVFIPASRVSPTPFSKGKRLDFACLRRRGHTMRSTSAWCGLLLHPLPCSMPSSIDRALLSWSTISSTGPTNAPRNNPPAFVHLSEPPPFHLPCSFPIFARLSRSSTSDSSGESSRQSLSDLALQHERTESCFRVHHLEMPENRLFRQGFQAFAPIDQKDKPIRLYRIRPPPPPPPAVPPVRFISSFFVSDP